MCHSYLISSILQLQKPCSIHLIQDNAKTHDHDDLTRTLQEPRTRSHHSNHERAHGGVLGETGHANRFRQPRRSRSYPPINRWESEPTTSTRPTTTRTTISSRPKPNKSCNSLSRIHKDHAPVLKHRSPSFNADCPSAATTATTTTRVIYSPPPSGFYGRCSTGQGDAFHNITSRLVQQ
jgi:hypothetical protein